VVSAVLQKRFHRFDDTSDVALGAGAPYANLPSFVRELLGHMHVPYSRRRGDMQKQTTPAQANREIVNHLRYFA
jgi:hypothetical protein